MLLRVLLVVVGTAKYQGKDDNLSVEDTHSWTVFNGCDSTNMGQRPTFIQRNGTKNLTRRRAWRRDMDWFGV